MRIETPEQWAKRVAAEIKRGQLIPAQVEEPAKREIREEAMRLAKEIGRERAAQYSSVAEKLRNYMVGE